MEEWIEKRIEENEKLFSEEELKITKNNFSLIKKMYLIGLINGREIYKNN